jgi:hypothetical protein
MTLLTRSALLGVVVAASCAASTGCAISHESESLSPIPATTMDVDRADASIVRPPPVGGGSAIDPGPLEPLACGRSTCDGRREYCRTGTQFAEGTEVRWAYCAPVPTTCPPDGPNCPCLFPSACRCEVNPRSGVTLHCAER